MRPLWTAGRCRVLRSVDDLPHGGTPRRYRIALQQGQAGPLYLPELRRRGGNGERKQGNDLMGSLLCPWGGWSPNGGQFKCSVFSTTSRINSSRSSNKPFPYLIAPIFAWVTSTSAAGRPLIPTLENWAAMNIHGFLLMNRSVYTIVIFGGLCALA